MGWDKLPDLKKITTFCRKNGIIAFRNADFELKLSRQALKLPKPRSTKVTVPIAGLPQVPSQEDMLLWSSRGADLNG